MKMPVVGAFAGAVLMTAALATVPAEAKDWPDFSLVDDETREFLSLELLKACLGE